MIVCKHLFIVNLVFIVTLIAVSHHDLGESVPGACLVILLTAVPTTPIDSPVCHQGFEVAAICKCLLVKTNPREVW